MEKNNKKIFIMIISLALVVITGTFAWLSWRSQNTAMVLTIGDIRGLTVTLTPYQISGSLSPVSSYTDGLAIDVTAANAKSEPDNFKLYYKIDTIDSALIDSGFKYTITKCTANCDTSSNYSVINNTGGNQSNMQNKTFQGELRANISFAPFNIMRDNSIIDNIASTFVTNTNGVQFSEISSDTNGKGIYVRAGTENDQYPIYYYRGNINNNNVLFAGFCWKIIRTTSTGGVKLIYNGLPSGTSNNQCTNITGTTTQLSAVSKFNNNDNSPADVGYMYGTRYIVQSQTMTGITDTYMYGTGYDETNHRLVTTNAMNFAGTNWATYYNQLNNNHYTCFNTSGECNQVYYIYYTDNSKVYYITIPSGKTISEMLDEMLTNSTNASDSIIKTAVETWYAANMTSYTSKLEDTPYCNDRSTADLGGWNPTGTITNYLSFGILGRINIAPYFTCNYNDAFTVSTSNGNGKLLYPVGLLTTDEINAAGGRRANSSYYLYTGQDFWSMSPIYFRSVLANDNIVYMTGGISVSNANVSNGVRPVISLKSGTLFSGGTGISTDPYVVE